MCIDNGMIETIKVDRFKGLKFMPEDYKASRFQPRINILPI